MEEVSDTIRAGERRGGDIHIEIWDRPQGWRMSNNESEPQEFILPSDAVNELGSWLLKG